MADKIDPALVKLTSESTSYYLTGFVQKGDPGYALIQTSTCDKGELARVRIYTETEWTKPVLYPAIAARYEWLRTHRPGYDYKQRLYYAGEPYGRKEGAVKKALSSVYKSS